MNQAFKETIQSIAANPLTIIILPILLTNLLTYYLAKRNTKSDKKNNIDQRSFELIYLPLYRKLKLLPSYNLSNNEAKKLYLQLHTLYEKYIVYCNPIINTLLEELKKNIDKKKNTNDVIYRLYSHIRDTYNKLRHRLNYPCISFFDAIKYRPLSSVILFFSSILWLVKIILFMILVLLIQYKSETIYVNYLIIVIVALFYIFIVLILFYIIFMLSDYIIKFIKRRINKSTSA